MSAALSPPRARRPVRLARVVIVDDQDLPRAGLRAILEGERDLVVVGEASNAREGLELVMRERPALALVDVRMPDGDGLSLTRQIKHACLSTSVVVITMYENPEYLLEAIRAGASGYVLKGATREEIVREVRRALRGELLLTSGLAVSLLDRLACQGGGQDRGRMERLTPREQDVLRLVAAGLTNQEIARRLGIRAGTVKINVERVLAKLGATNRTQAAVRALENRLIAPQSTSDVSDRY